MLHLPVYFKVGDASCNCSKWGCLCKFRSAIALMNFSEVMWLMLIGLLSYVIEMTDANGPVIAEPYQQVDLGKLFQEI